MRLYSTLARDLVELPTPPGPIGMYVCGPTVYARAHIGNARPYVLAVWYKRWLRERGYDVPRHRELRFDVVGLRLDGAGRVTEYEHLEGAF